MALWHDIQTDSDSNLKCLLLGGNNLASLEPALLASCVSKLEELRLRRSSLSDQQVEAILRQCANGTNLKMLMLKDTTSHNLDPDLVNATQGLIEHVYV